MAEFTLYNGDCLHVMRAMEPNTIDTIITDPPYGLSFMGKEWDHGVPGVPFWQAALHVAKPGAMLFAFGGTRTQHRLTVAIEDAGWEIRDVIMWVYGSGFPKSHDISKGIDRAAGAEREVVGVRKLQGSARILKGNNFNGGYEGQTITDEYNITTPATDAAKLWDGWGTSLKPSWEPIIVAMKPLDGTFADNAQKWGVAGLWIDGGRVGAEGWMRTRPDHDGYNYQNVDLRMKSIPFQESTQGRFPANLIHDGSAEVTALFPEARGGGTNGVRKHEKPMGYGLRARTVTNGREPDTGNASRFFYCAKAGKEERNAGLAGMPERVGAKQFNEGMEGKTRSDGTVIKDAIQHQNHHPTIKPLSLMDYLCTLTKTPTGGVVLDPFMGSGSTGAACMRTGRNFKGIDLNPEYVAIAEARIKHWAALSSAEWTAQPIQVTPQPGGFSDLPLFAEATP